MQQVFTVSQINGYVKQLLDTDALLSGLCIEGEISNLNRHSSGHMYFSLKDSSAHINCVMFATSTEKLTFMPTNGQKVISMGRLSLYEKTGQYQFYVNNLEPAGIGGLQLAFIQLVDKLKAEGLFEESRKNPIPPYPDCVAIITSPTGAAIRDILKIAHRRNPTTRLILAPVQVQGQDAAKDIARAIDEVNDWGMADVIILGRGGGSTEDLWAFNEEVTARAIARSKIPIISAVGHEVDITISDFVADCRASTPTAAAQMVVYDQMLVARQLQMAYSDLNKAIINNINNLHAYSKSQLVQLCSQADYRLSQEKAKLTHVTNLLEKISPYAVFKRGFALVKDEKGQAVQQAKSLKNKQVLHLQWADGQIDAQVIRKN